MNYKDFQQLKNLRPIARNEVVLDCDDREHGDLGILRICQLFAFDDYKIEIYKAEGQKSYHAHIRNIPHILELSKDQNKFYKELLIKKYISKVRELVESPEMDKIDFSLCIPDHLVAEENKPHFKYKTEKKLIAVVNKGYQNFCDKEIYDLTIQEKTEYKPTIKGSGITAKIIQKISIIDLARRHNIKVTNNGSAVCVFHEDNEPSLKFYDDQGRFHCFGCLINGNLVDFIYLLRKYGIKELKNA